jgi:hypothetical protein
MAVDTLTIEEKKPVVEVTANSEKRDRVIIWYHNSDYDLVKALDPHLKLLALRLGLVLHYFGYPKTALKEPTPPTTKSDYFVKEYEKEKAAYEQEMKEQQERYEAVVYALQQRCALFVPCVSNECMLQLGNDTNRDSRLASLFVQPAFQIMPVTIRPTNTGESNPSEPLAAHQGYQLEMACQKIAATMEGMLRTSPYYQPRQKQTPLATLFLPAPAPQVVGPTTSKKRWWSFLQ